MDLGQLRVDDEGIELRVDDPGVVDVLMDGRRVWSLSPADFPRRRNGTRYVRWPAPIRRHLDGEADVELRDHATGDLVGATPARFGTGTGRVSIVDRAGRPLALTKWGRLNRPFELTERAELEAYLDQAQEVLDVLRDECGLPAFISFGTLLGAVRTGKLIGHDVDIDLGYLSAHGHPADMMRESFQVERALRAKGWDVVRENGGFLALFFPQPGGGSRNLDVFTAFCVEDHLYQPNDVGAVADRSAILPLQQISLEGRDMPAPARPDVLFEAAYGPGWRVPDPAFQFRTSDRTKRRLLGWLGGLRARRDYWRKFYGGEASSRVPLDASDFARWFVDREPVGTVIDVGCGNGRDAYYLAGRGHTVHGFDLLPWVARRSRSKLPTDVPRKDEDGADGGASFAQLNLSSLSETLVAGARAAHGSAPCTVYGRFLLHALPDDARENFWRFTSMALSGGGRCYVEFRTERDRNTPKAFGEHFRRFLDPDLVVAEAARHGGVVVHREQGRGRAKFEKENPHVCRLVLEWDA